MCKTMERVITSRKVKREGGYMLLETTLTILIIGLLIVGFIQFQKFFSEREQSIQTQNGMENIVDALSTYAQMRWRLPCPADPVKQAGIAYGTERATGCAANVADTYGIVPYRTLGIPEQYAKDAYGNFYTYVVSPVFTRNNEITGIGASDRTQARFAHYLAPQNIGFLPKAQFCGGVENIGGTPIDATTDLSPELAGELIFSSARDDTNFVDRPLVSAPDPNYFRTTAPNTRIDAFAVAIISHGPNGYGAYLEDNSGGQNIALPGFGTSENDTRITANRLVAIEREIRRAGGAGNYDDIITVLTQDQVLAAAGGGSCEHP